jgi:hypothetical protein
MAAVRDKCPGCGHEFAPKGFSNHLQLSCDPRCVSIRECLRPVYPPLLNTEAPCLSPGVDVNMMDLSDEPIPPFQRSNGTNSDTEPSQHGDNGTRHHPFQPILEAAPNLVPHLPSAQVSVVIDSDIEDSDEECDQETHLETEVPPGSRDILDANTEHPSMGAHMHTTHHSKSNSNSSSLQFTAQGFNQQKSCAVHQEVSRSWKSIRDATGTSRV